MKLEKFLMYKIGKVSMITLFVVIVVILNFFMLNKVISKHVQNTNVEHSIIK
ncbi:hypothetical protein SAMN05444411_10144 [Lutibacter oricola]|uniref:Uncharacterized protein n=1 Tax=Lutibacter oricola TaxID=762486 RepID=A0A1H2QN56_9FLAO|nr:hypothetical protein [Lutibacter oricola]SDW08596.1 hypothetical protein SAMN05444411_10144 [Lutibacter oricola]